MSAALPPEITVVELPEGGALYRLPIRPSPILRLVGLIPIAFGTFILSWPFVGIVFFFVMGAMQHDIWFAVLGPLGCFGPISFPLGGFFLWMGLCAAFGHTEVRVADGRLAWTERFGWLRWWRSRPLEQVNGFSIDHGASTPPGRSVSPMSLADVAKLTAECGGRSINICGGYPRAWLRALADELARHCQREAAPRGTGEAAEVIAVTESSQDPRAVQDRLVRPAGSPAILEEGAASITITIPPLGLRGCNGFLLIWTLGWNGFLLIFAPLMLYGAATEQVQWNDGPQKASLLFVSLFLSPFLLVGLGAYLGVRHQARRSAVLEADAGWLAVQLTGVFGTTAHEWRRDELRAVGVASKYNEDSEGSGGWVTSLVVTPNEGEPVRMLDHRPKAELEWVATLLRKTLRVPSSAS